MGASIHTPHTHIVASNSNRKVWRNLTTQGCTCVERVFEGSMVSLRSGDEVGEGVDLEGDGDIGIEGEIALEEVDDAHHSYYGACKQSYVIEAG